MSQTLSVNLMSRSASINQSQQLKDKLLAVSFSLSLRPQGLRGPFVVNEIKPATRDTQKNKY